MDPSRPTPAPTPISCGYPMTYPRHPLDFTRAPTPAPPRHTLSPPLPLFPLFPFSPLKKPGSRIITDPRAYSEPHKLPQLLLLFVQLPLVVLVPHMGQRMSISFSSPMNFSLSVSGPKKEISPQAHAGHSARTTNFFLAIFPPILSAIPGHRVPVTTTISLIITLAGRGKGSPAFDPGENRRPRPPPRFPPSPFRPLCYHRGILSH